MRAPFLGQAYQGRSKILANQSAINIYSETSEGNSDQIGAFYGTPGLVTKYSGNGEVRGLHVAGGYLFAVIGNTVVRLNSVFSATNLGTIPTISGPVSMVHNESQLAVAHPNGWHYVTFAGSAIAAVSGSPTSSIVTYQDQYVLFTATGGQFGLTALANLASISALNVADAEGAPDNLVSIISDHREAWLFGEETTEIWSNTGASFFPFERAPGGFIEQGCTAKFSPAKLDNSVFWLGRDRNGLGVVYRANAYIPQRISTHAIEYAINQYSRIDDAIGWAQQEEGHSFYFLTFPTGNATWVFDTATGGWHQRGWLNNSGTLDRHRSNCYATFNGQHLVGDWQNGKIYAMSLQSYLDDNNEIYRERAFSIPDTEEKKFRIDKLELIATQGDGYLAWTADITTITADSLVYNADGSAGGMPQRIWLQISRDSGNNFGEQRIIDMGDVGQTTARLRWRRAGAGRNLVCRIGTTMASRVQWHGVNIEGEVLSQ